MTSITTAGADETAPRKQREDDMQTQHANLNALLDDPASYEIDGPRISAGDQLGFVKALRWPLFAVPAGFRRARPGDVIRLVYLAADGSEETVFERVLPKDNAA